MKMALEEVVQSMIDIYNDNTEEGYTSTAGLGLLVEVVTNCEPEDRITVFNMFEEIVGPMEEANAGC